MNKSTWRLQCRPIYQAHLLGLSANVALELHRGSLVLCSHCALKVTKVQARAGERAEWLQGCSGMRAQLPAGICEKP